MIRAGCSYKHIDKKRKQQPMKKLTRVSPIYSYVREYDKGEEYDGHEA
jgi:hypothetical protein